MTFFANTQEFNMANIKRLIILTVVKIFNMVYNIFKFIGWDLVPMTLENVIKNLTPEEREQLPKQNLGEPIKIILDEFNNPSHKIPGFQKLTQLEMMRMNLKRMADVRLATVNNPDIANTSVDGPVVIIGLARSGTTMLQRLLACDPQFICPMMWEMLNPTPPGRPENWRDCERYKTAKKEYDDMATLQTSAFKTMHSVSADEHDECMMLLGHCLLSVIYSNVPYMKKLRDFQIHCSKEYQRRSYEYYKMALQCLFYKNLDDGKKLLLKSPVHLLYLDTYKEVLPNAKFIFTYRHLPTAMASFASLSSEAMIMFGSEVEHHHVRDLSLQFYKHGCRRAVNVFKKIREDSLITMGYSELIKDPMAAVREIYSRFNLKLTPEVESSMQRHLAENQQHKFGKHIYKIEDFGISEDEIKMEFKEFLEYFKDSPEKLL